MRQWRWIDKQLLLMLHDESLTLHCGASGIRDEGLLDSALSRAINLAHYGDPDYADLAAAYAVGLAKIHPKTINNLYLCLGTKNPKPPKLFIM